MKRRKFLASSFAASTLLGGTAARGLTAPQDGAKQNSREFYELRRYQLQSGAQVKGAHDFFRDALIPALNRLGIKPVGIFNVSVGDTTPTVYLLLPSPTLETLVSARFLLERDADYLKAGEPFLNIPAKMPAYVRVESSLMVAFEGKPKLTVPPGVSEHRARMFELRTYESATEQDHLRKVEMFNSGEYDVFQKAGFWQVFYGDTLIGQRLPNLTYMLGFPDLAARDKMWDAFRLAPEWKKLTGLPRFNFEDIVSNITNVILSPTPYSQI